MAASKSLQLMVSAVVLAFIVWSLVEALEESNQWSQYKRDFNKSYPDPEEEALRRRLFEVELLRIELHNSDTSSSYTLGLNHMSDWTQDELNMMLNWHTTRVRMHHSLNYTLDPYVVEILKSNVKDPTEHDWRLSRAIGSVKNQSKCGSCWAFATTALLESQQTGRMFNMTHIIPLSEQQLLDCGEPNKNLACQGGTVDQALDEIARAGGIMSEQDYPYEAAQKKCLLNPRRFAMRNVKGWAALRPDNEEEMMKVLHRYGPVAVSVASCSWKNYHSGVLPASMCDGRVNHAALIVGYGHDCRSGLDYWLVQNSWGSGFGEGGYIKVERNKNACRIADEPLIARLK